MPSPQLQQKFHALQQAFESQAASKQADVTKKLTVLKLDLAKAGLLFPSSSADRTDLLVARSALEIGAFHSLRIKDVPAFERYMSQLTVFYRDLSTVLEPSPSRPPLTGLALLSLLASGRIADFHTLLESLAGEGAAGNKLLEDEFVAWPVDLERWLMEGSYSKVWRARERVPRPEYGVLLDGLVGTIRNEIAQCQEKAYTSLPLSDATRLLFFTTSNETLQFGQSRGWEFSPGKKVFSFPTSSINDVDMAAGQGKDSMIKTVLGYANELEAIV